MSPIELPFPAVRIGAFRSLRAVNLEACGRINVLVGGNNSGKTSVLEAIMVLAAPANPHYWRHALGLRTAWPFGDSRGAAAGPDELTSLRWMFPQGRVLGAGVDGEAIHLAGGAGLTVRVTATTLEGEPPRRPVDRPDELIAGVYRLGRMRPGPLASDLGPEGPGDDEAPSLVPGLALEIVAGDDPGGGIWADVASAFRLVFWERGTFPPNRRMYAQQRSLWDAARARPVEVAMASTLSHRSDGLLQEGFSRLVHTKAADQALELLQRLDPRIRELVIVNSLEPDEVGLGPAMRVGRSGPSLHVEYEGTGLVPVHAMGDGMRRALHFAVALAALPPGGVFVIDEIDVGLHPSVLQSTFSWLCEACAAQQVQLFATTHSLEAVDALIHERADDVVLYRLKNGQARRFSGSTLRTLRTELGQDVR